MSDICTTLKSAISAAAAISAGAVLVRIIANLRLPSPFFPNITLIIDESDDDGAVYRVVDLYLSTLASGSTIANGKKITDRYWGCCFTWTLVSRSSKQRSFHLTFHINYRDIVLKSYLPHISDRSRVLQLYTNGGKDCWWWRAVDLPPTTFERVAAKESAMVRDNLYKFLALKDSIIRETHRSWRLEYLMYGPSRAEKSILVAAMATLLKYNVYDLNLSQVESKVALLELLMRTRPRSILVVRLEKEEEHPSREEQEEYALPDTYQKIFHELDGAMDSREGRIIVYTTNYKQRLHSKLMPGLRRCRCLAPGWMVDIIHMSSGINCTTDMLRILAFNYFLTCDNPLLLMIQGLLQEADVSPAQVAEELFPYIKCEHTLRHLIECLRMKKDDKSNAHLHFAEIQS